MSERPQILCIGAMLWDIIGRSFRPLHRGNDVPGRIGQVPGGVALNVAVSLARQGKRAAILTAIGADPAGEALREEAGYLGVNTEYIYLNKDLPSDFYIAIEDPNGLVASIADAHSLEAAGDLILAPLRDGRLASAESPWTGPIVLDGNLTSTLLAEMAVNPLMAQAKLRVIPASPGKAERLIPLLGRPDTLFYLNREEAETLAGRPCRDAVDAAQAVVAKGAARAIVTNGPDIVADAIAGAPTLISHPAKVEIMRVTGAGDAFLAVHLAAEEAGLDRQTALEKATRAATDHVAGKDLI